MARKASSRSGATVTTARGGLGEEADERVAEQRDGRADTVPEARLDQGLGEAPFRHVVRAGQVATPGGLDQESRKVGLVTQVHHGRAAAEVAVDDVGPL